MNRMVVVSAILMLVLGVAAWGAAHQSTSGSQARGAAGAGVTLGSKAPGNLPTPPDSDHRGIGTPIDTGQAGSLPRSASNVPLLAAIGLAALGGALTVRSIAKRAS